MTKWWFVALTCVAMLIPSMADAKNTRRNIWRYIGFGNGPGYHSDDCCRPSRTKHYPHAVWVSGCPCDYGYAGPWAPMTPVWGPMPGGMTDPIYEEAIPSPMEPAEPVQP